MLIIKLGGSLILNNLTEFNPLIIDLINKLKSFDDQILITVGGGKICRFFQNQLKQQGINRQKELNLTGIASVQLNAQYLRSLLSKEKTYPHVINSDLELKHALDNKESYKYFICGGSEINHSSDYDAVEMAENFGSNYVLRISDVDFIYDSDPDLNPTAKKIKQITWDHYINDILGKNTEFKPGGSYPVDPVAARYAARKNISFYFISLTNFIENKILDLENFTGTIIK